MVWGVSPDPADKLVRWAERAGVTYPLLSDADSSVIRRYGILNEKQGEIPHPTTIVVDREGVVRYVVVNRDFKVRPPAQDVLDAAQAAAVPAPGD